jgi:hypothetical protein
MSSSLLLASCTRGAVEHRRGRPRLSATGRGWHAREAVRHTIANTTARAHGRSVNDRGARAVQGEQVSGFVRPIEGWELLGDPSTDPVLRFECRWYLEPGGHPQASTAQVEATAFTPCLRRALAAFVLLGTVSPTDVAAIAAEAAAAASEGGSRAGAPSVERGAPPTLAGGLARGFARLHPQLPAALDDPMRGVLATPLHVSLFPGGGGLLAAFERLLALEPAGVEDALLAYPRFYRRCRQAILHLGLLLARNLPALAPSSSGPDDFFTWWRTRWTRRATIELSAGGGVSIGFPEELPAIKAAAITAVLAKLALDHERLAARLDRAGATRDFIDALAAELLDGAASLLLNGREGARCPRPEQIAVSRERGHRYPTRAQVAKKVQLDGAPFEDCFGRFFAATETRLRLPRSGREVTVWRLGTCPFPDYGFVGFEP